MGMVEAGILVLVLFIVILIPFIVILRRQMRTLREVDRLAEQLRSGKTGAGGMPGESGPQAGLPQDGYLLREEGDRASLYGREAVLWEEEEEDDPEL